MPNESPSHFDSNSNSNPSSNSNSIEKNVKVKTYLIITNISKKPNIKSLLRTAVAFGCQTIFVAGQRKFNFDHEAIDSDIPTSLKSYLSLGLMEIIKFEKLEECVEYIRTTLINSSFRGGGDGELEELAAPVRIIGVEIDETAVDIEEAVESGQQQQHTISGDCYFKGDTVFMMGNEGSGMNDKQMSLCDGFVKIKQYGGGTASLNVNVAAGVVLHRFHQWASSQS